MNWLKRLFGAPKTESTKLPACGDEPSLAVVQTFQTHMNRIRRVMSDDRMKTILDDLEVRFLENALAIDAMVRNTISDRQLHTKSIAGGSAITWVVVSAVPRDRSESAAFFGAEYPPGYGGYVNFWLNSQPAQLAKTFGHTVFAHVLVYADGSVGFGLCPLDLSNPASCPKLVFPEESMTEEDRRLMGMGVG